MNHHHQDSSDHRPQTDAERANATLDALVAEAYQRELDRGAAITNPDAWRSWKRSVYVEQAKREGAGYLRKHYQRLGLGAAARVERTPCAKCGMPVHVETRRDDEPNAIYCSYECAGIETLTLRQFAERTGNTSLLRYITTPAKGEDATP